MLGVAARLTLFATAAAAAFGAAFTAGALSDRDRAAVTAGPAAPPVGAAAAPTYPPAAAALPGLAVADRGYILRVPDVTLPGPARTQLAFTVEGPDGRPVGAYRPTHDKEMHLIVVRRDLSLFQHLHPERDPAGVWIAEVDLPAAGTYRMIADFAPADLPDATLTLGADVFVPGELAPAGLPAPAEVAEAGGYEVRIAGGPRAGVAAELEFAVSRAGAPVADLEPYLAAFGHLVSLRSGDLAYVRTRPAGETGAAQHGGPTVRFDTIFPTPGAYRLFLNFAHAGQVRTAAFTVDVPAAGEPAAGGHASH